MNITLNLYFIFIASLFSCHGQTENEQIKFTTLKVIEAIQDNDESKFKRLIGVELLQIGKNQELLHYDFNRMNSLYNRYAIDSKPKINITNQYNELGSLKVIIPLSDIIDSLTSNNIVQLELYFGPPNFVPLNKISNYKIVINKDFNKSVVAPKNEQ